MKLNCLLYYHLSLLPILLIHFLLLFPYWSLLTIIFNFLCFKFFFENLIRLHILDFHIFFIRVLSIFGIFQ